MELQFQTQQIEASSITKHNKETGRTINKSKFVGVRQRPSGKWVAEIKNTTQKIRMWLGTFDTAEEAARAYDEAACLLGGSNTRTNFVDHIPPGSALSLKIKNLVHDKKSMRQKQKDPKEASVPNSASATNISSYSSTLSSPIHGQGLQIFDDAYKPDLSTFSGGLDMSNPDVENQMKVERQITASLYAINGVNWDNIHDCGCDAFWDLPLLCQS